MTFGDTIWNVQTWFSKAGPDESGDQNLIAGRSCCQFFQNNDPIRVSSQFRSYVSPLYEVFGLLIGYSERELMSPLETDIIA